VGATPIQNVGAYGQEVAETLLRVEALDRFSLRRLAFSRDECGFAYRNSRFRQADRNRCVLLSATFRLRVQGPPSVRYPELAAYLSDGGLERPTLHDLRQATLTLRRRKAMVFDPDDPESHSVGSFFTNPVVETAVAKVLEAQLQKSGLLDKGERMPSFPAADGRSKLSAAWLIERAGFPKGHAHGGVGISNRHALALVNRGGGTAREIVELARRIRDRVHERFGIVLEPEPVLVGLEL
jgi:UDP-N-acetylmuramate dehydrogenase